MCNELGEMANGPNGRTSRNSWCWVIWSAGQCTKFITHRTSGQLTSDIWGALSAKYIVTLIQEGWRAHQQMGEPGGQGRRKASKVRIEFGSDMLMPCTRR